MAHPIPGTPVPNGPVFNVLFQEAVDVFVEELNDYFKEWIFTKQEYATKPGDLLNQKLFISTASPEDDRFLPAIIVRYAPASEFRQSLNNFLEHLEDLSGNAIGRRYGGRLRTTFNFTVCSLESFDLDRITDFLTLGLLVVKVPAIQSRGVWLLPNTLSVSDPGPFAYTGDRSLLRKLVSVDCWIEWYVDILDTEPPAGKFEVHIVTKDLAGRTIGGIDQEI